MYKKNTQELLCLTRAWTKFWRIMKLSILFVIISIFYANAEGKAQHVTIVKQSLSMKDAFREIKKQTGYNFLWDAKEFNSSVAVKLSLENAPLDRAIRSILQGKPLSYEIKERTIVIREKQSVSSARSVSTLEPNKEVNTTLFQQDFIPVVEGIVQDSLGKPIVGASITVHLGNEALSLQGRTDSKGHFILKNVPRKVVLHIRSVGYKSIQANVRADMGMITLHVENEKIEEVVITGIFERSASTYTGSVNTINKEAIRRVGNQNVLDILSVLDPSIQAMQNLANGSDPNKIADLRLRGASSIPATTNVSSGATSNQRGEKDYYKAYDSKVDDIKNVYTVNPNLPLFVLDGFEVSIERINDIDINEVNSITILKDASATAIYGSRGANGVIVFERIKPQAGEMLFGYKSDVTFSFPDLHDYQLLNAREKLEVEVLAGVYSYGTTDRDVILNQVYNEKYKEVLRGRDTYWPSLPLRNSVGHKHRLTMEGGAGVVSYGMDFTYNKNTGAMKGSSRDSYNGGISLSYRGSKLQVLNQLNVQFTNAFNSPWGSFSQYVRMNPYYSPYDENGNIVLLLQKPVLDIQSSVYGRVYNPVFNTTLNGKDFRKTQNLINNTSITYKFTPNFNLRGRLSVTNQRDNSELFLPAEHTTYQQRNVDVLKRGGYTAGYGKQFSYDGNVDLNYNFTRQSHQLFTTLSGRMNENAAENVVLQVEGLPSPLTDYVFYGKKYVNDRPSGSESTIRTVGFLGNVNYAYDNRYLLDFSYRLDGSSSVGSDRLFSPFWSVGAGWNLHQERFMSNLVAKGMVNQLRVRGSVGLTGAQQFNSYMAYRTYNYSLDDAYLNSIGANMINIGNPELTWQGTQKRNLGFDISLLNSRLQINGDYYNDFTDKFIASFSLPLSTGFESYMGNLGAIKSIGYEARMSYQVIQPKLAKDFGLTLMANIGHNNSVVDKISDELKSQNEKLASITDSKNPFTKYEEGSSMDAIWVVPSLGIDPATGQEMFLKKDGSSTFVWSADDMVAAGVSTPKYRGTLGFNMSYAGFQLNTYFSYRMGGQLFNQTLLERIENVNLVDNADRRVLTDRWKAPGDIASFKAISISGSNTNASSRFVQNDNTFEMTSASLLYRFDNAKVKQWGFRNLNFGLYMNDVFRLSKIKVERGLDYPFARNFSLSLQTNF